MKINRNKVLTDSEIQGFKGMNRYWREVREREDTSPLVNETSTMIRLLGVRLLLLMEHYIELLEDE